MSEINIEIARQSWNNAPDEHVCKAVNNLDDYDTKVRGIILEEARKRRIVKESIQPNQRCTQESMSSKFLNKLLYVVFWIIIFGIIDLGLFVFYEAYDYIRVDRNLDGLKIKIEKLETQINLKKLQIDSVKIENNLLNLPDNEEEMKYYLANTFTKDELGYIKLITEHDDLVNEYNSNVKKYIARYYLIPIPIKTRGARPFR